MSFYDQQKAHQQKLERFRQSFLLLTQDGQYPPERQNRLYQATIQAGLDWNEARQFGRPDATAFFQRHLTTLLSQGDLPPDAIDELNRLRRRLGLDATVTANLSRSSPPSRPTPPAKPSAPATQPTAWSDLKMIITGVILIPIIWVGLVFLTMFCFALMSMLIGTAIMSKLIPIVSLLEFFLAIFFTVRILRRWRRPTIIRPPVDLQPQQEAVQPPVYQYHQVVPSPVYSSPAPAPLPLTPSAPHTMPRLLVNGVSLANSVQNLSSAEFEHWVKDRLVELGWQQARVMGGRGDRGVDIRGIYQGKKCIVQCKHYKGRLVPPNEVRALVGTRNIQRAQRAYLITSGKFGYQCFHESDRKPVELGDLETLATHLNNQIVSVA
jgi:hypothetical protein